LSANANQIRPLTWEDIASPLWYGDGQLGTIWLSAFLMMQADRSQISPHPAVMDFGDARALALYGQLPYVGFSTNEIRSTDTTEFHITPEELTSPEGSYLLIVVRFDDSDAPHSESIARARVSELAGLLAALFGPNIVCRRLFDNLVRPQSNQRTAFGDVFRNPASLPFPNLDSARIRMAHEAHAALSRLPPREANRVSLSLRWYSEAHHAAGVDSFLKLWVATEALGMSDRDNVRPIVEALARSYGIAFHDARDKFHLGRLFGYRSRIVHQGQIRPIHSLLLDYLASIYQDVLYERLGLPAEGFAERIQGSPGFDIASFIS